MKKVLCTLVFVSFWTSGCSFNFEVTSQRTALENQVLGSYKELDDDLVLSSSVRSLDSSGKKKTIEISELQKLALKARQRQDFNRDDLDELKDKQIIGELNNGRVGILPATIAPTIKFPAEQIKFAKMMVDQENQDREVIWRRIVLSNENFTEKDLGNVQKTFAKSQRESAKIGQWIQEVDGTWSRKSAMTGK